MKKEIIYHKEHAVEICLELEELGIDDCYVSGMGHLVVNKIKEGEFNKQTLVVETGDTIIVRNFSGKVVVDVKFRSA